MVWRCPPGEAYAVQLGLYYKLRSSSETNWIFQKNFVHLEDYLKKPFSVKKEVATTVLSLVEDNPEILLSDLLEKVAGATVDDLNFMIATRQVYVDLNSYLLDKPEEVKVYLHKEIALAYSRLLEISAPTAADSVRLVDVRVGTYISYDGEPWEIINTGESSIALLRSDKHYIELPNSLFKRLIQEGKIVGFTQSQGNP
jgi:putative transposase